MPFTAEQFADMLEYGERVIRARLKRRNRWRCQGISNEAVSAFHLRLVSIIAGGRVSDTGDPRAIAASLAEFAVRSVMGDGRSGHYRRWLQMVPESDLPDYASDGGIGYMSCLPNRDASGRHNLTMPMILNAIRGVVPGLEYRMIAYMAEGYTREETARRFNVRPKDFKKILRKYRAIIRWAIDRIE